MSNAGYISGLLVEDVKAMRIYLRAALECDEVSLTDVGGLGEAVLHERTGLLVPPEDAAALQAALARLIREPALREDLGAAGPARIAQRYDAEAMVEAYERLYFEVLAERSRA